MPPKPGEAFRANTALDFKQYKRAEQQHVIDAYSRSIQGFFVKPASYDKLKRIIVKIVEYWQECESPNYIKNVQ